MNCLANILCCGSAMLAVGIAGVATLCSSRMTDGRRGRNEKVCGCVKTTAEAIARAAGYNYLKLRVYSNPNFGSEGWDSDSASDEDEDDDDDDDDDDHVTISHDRSEPSTSSDAQQRGHASTCKEGMFGNAGDHCIADLVSPIKPSSTFS